jgi:hypothetical protein
MSMMVMDYPELRRSPAGAGPPSVEQGKGSVKRHGSTASDALRARPKRFISAAWIVAEPAKRKN